METNFWNRPLGNLSRTLVLLTVAVELVFLGFCMNSPPVTPTDVAPESLSSLQLHAVEWAAAIVLGLKILFETSPLFRTMRRQYTGLLWMIGTPVLEGMLLLSGLLATVVMSEQLSALGSLAPGLISCLGNAVQILVTLSLFSIPVRFVAFFLPRSDDDSTEKPAKAEKKPAFPRAP